MGIQQSGTYGTARWNLGDAVREYDPLKAGFIGARVLPILPVGLKAANFPKITRESILKRAAAKRASRSAYNRIHLETEDDSYECIEYGLENLLGDEERRFYASDFDAEVACVEQIVFKLLLEHEVRVRDLVMNTSTWTGSALYTDVSSAPWDAAASDIPSHVRAAVEKVRRNYGMRPTALVVSAAQMPNILSNTEVKKYFPGAPVITEGMMRSNLPLIFGLDELVIGGQVYDTADDGQAATLADVWSDDYAMVAVLSGGGSPIRTPGLGRTFLWAEDTPTEATVESYYSDELRSDVFRVRQYTDEKVFDAYAGHLLKIDA